MNDERLGSYLRGRLEGYTHPVDESLWPSVIGAVGGTIGGDAPPKSVPPKKNRLLLPLIVSGAIAAMIALAVLLTNTPPGTANEERMTDNAIQPAKSEQQPTVTERQHAADGHRPQTVRQRPEDNESETLPNEETRPNGPTAENTAEAEAAKAGVAEEKTVPGNEPENSAAAGDKAAGDKTGQSNSGATSGERERSLANKQESIASARPSPATYSRQGGATPGEYDRATSGRREKRAGGTSLSLAMGGASGSGGWGRSGDYATSSPGDPQPDSTLNRSTRGQTLGTISPNEIRQTDMKDPQYDFPVNFTLTVRRNITRRLSVETGLSYTFLHTWGGSGMSTSEIKLHYLGIPFKAIYTLYGGRVVSFYGSAGGMAEMQVAGRLITAKGEWNIRNSRVQWSVGAAAGMNVALGRRVGIFAEPGVAYFFDEGSGIPTIRKAKPFNFNMQLGLRFNIN